MNNLMDDELKKSFKKELLSALRNIKNPDANITIKFTDDKEVIDKEKIKIILGSIHFKNVNLSSLGKEKAIDVIIDNMYYNYFAYIDTKIKIGKTECHGFGDYWGTDTVVIHYHRFKENEL